VWNRNRSTSRCKGRCERRKGGRRRQKEKRETKKIREGKRKRKKTEKGAWGEGKSQRWGSE